MSAADHERAASGTTDPTEAAEHKAAATDLRRAEQFACADVPDADRSGGPFTHRDWIAGVEVVRERFFPKAQAPLQPAGVAVYLRATPGITEQWIGRVIECHLAHRLVVGDGVAEQTCPLTLDDTRVGVSSTPTGFRVAVTSKDITVARSLIDRCQALLN
jgi:hypothetical protein